MSLERLDRSEDVKMSFGPWGARPIHRTAATWPAGVSAHDGIIVFDGVCNFCNGSVQFLLRRERDATLRFAPAQTDVGSALLACHGMDAAQLESILLVEDEFAYQRSDAILRIVRHLSWPWQWLRLGWLLPRGIRDALYNTVARNRYRWFGQRESCMIPTKELRARFFG